MSSLDSLELTLDQVSLNRLPKFSRAPIFNMDGRVIGANVIVAPSFRLRPKDLPLFGQRVKKAALEIFQNMGYSFSTTHRKDNGGK